LRQLGLDRDSSIILETTDAALVARPQRPAWRLAHHGERAPWDLVHAGIAHEANYTPSFSRC
jgi:hypothetical protein